MTPLRPALCILAFGITAMVPPHAAAQNPQPPAAAPRAAAQAPQPPAPVAPTPPEVPPEREDRDFEGRSVVRIGQDYRLREGETVEDTVVIMGNATIEGNVDQNVVVILGTARIASTAVIRQDLVVIGGGVSVAPGAQVGHDFVVVGGTTDIAPDFVPGGEHVVIGAGLLGMKLDAFVPWLTRGLLWGRPIVPDLPWMWVLVGVFFFVYLVLNQIAHGPVSATAAVLMEKPLTAFGSGLLVLLLLGPVCLLLAVSVVGIAVVPFVLCAVLIASVIGKIGVMQWIGLHLVRDTSPEAPRRALLAFVVGFVILTIAYMIPVLGFAAWAVAGVLGLGAAALAFMAAYRREQPRPVATVAAFSAPPPVPVPYPPDPSRYPGSQGEIPVAAPAAVMSTPVVATTAAPAADVPFTAPPSIPPAGGLTLMPRASFRDRLAALVLDLILVVFVVQMLDFFRGERVTFLAILVYHIGFWTWKQTTVGGMICQLRIVRVDGRPIAFADALVRGFSAIFSVIVIGLGFLWILKDPERQAWHDKIAGTYVVKVPRNWPS